MKRAARILIMTLCLAGPARAGVPVPAQRARRQEAREALQEGKRRVKRVGEERHKELLLLREREKSDLRLAKASAARGEALHLLILEIHEKSRRDRLALRARAREERERLRRVMKNERDRLIALRHKK